MSKWLVALAVVLLLIVALTVGGRWHGRGHRPRARPGCAHAHADKKDGGLQYPWLDGVHGGLLRAEYEEPAGSGVWRSYTEEIWGIHCRVVSHDPAVLVEKHMSAFVDPKERFARLRFTFRDGFVVLSDDAAAFRSFYELERGWFAA